MTISEKKLLVDILASSLGAKRHTPSSKEMNHLSKIGYVKDGKITKLGRSRIRLVLAGGVFDIIHPGHIHTLNEAKNLGDMLIVVVATDLMAEKGKKRTPLHTKEQRQILVSSISMVDVCMIGSEKDIFETVKIVDPDIVALGYDQTHQEKTILDGCIKRGLHTSVARLQSPMPDMSSSEIRKEYDTEIHGL
ncbi:MAG: cytidyltransferase-like protein [Cenarchaeum symbiont of Oopsacas minuta]|nr:cytidyltransferase-like protein [Cenarchaeum symbiont of Oopsacas minuta]